MGSEMCIRDRGNGGLSIWVADQILSITQNCSPWDTSWMLNMLVDYEDLVLRVARALNERALILTLVASCEGGSSVTLTPVGAKYGDQILERRSLRFILSDGTKHYLSLVPGATEVFGRHLKVSEESEPTGFMALIAPVLVQLNGFLARSKSLQPLSLERWLELQTVPERVIKP